MGRNSGGVVSVKAGGKKSKADYDVTPQTIQDVKSAIKAYSVTDKWNQNTAYNLGFNGVFRVSLRMLLMQI